jgi:hypothetical protein
MPRRALCPTGSFIVPSLLGRSVRGRNDARERALLRLIDRQQQMIADLVSRVMFMADRSWVMPPAPEPADLNLTDEDEQGYVSSLHGLPPGYEEEE